DENPPAKPPKKNDQSSEPAKKPDAATTTSDKKPTKAPESTKSSNTNVKPTSSVQTKSDKKKAPSSTKGSSQGLSQSSASRALPSSIQPSNSNDPLIEATSEPQDDTLATPSASELDSLAVTATDEALNSVSVTPSANVLDSGSVIATSELPDALSEAPSASVTDSPLSSSEQPEYTEVQPMQTMENEITATALPASEDDSTIASAETLEDQSSLLDDPLAVTAEPQQTLEGEATATDQSLITETASADDSTIASAETLEDQSSLLDDPLAVTAEPQQTLEGEATATDESLMAETGDASSAIESPYLPTLADVGTSPESVETPLPTTLETSNPPQTTFTPPPEASLACPPKSTGVSAAASNKPLVKRAGAPATDFGAELQMREMYGLGATYWGYVGFQHDLDCWELKEYAVVGYNQIRNKPNINGIVIVAALWIPKVGVVVGSKPRAAPGPGTETQRSNAVAAQMADIAESWFPAYWNLVRHRYHRDPRRQGEIDKWHAEDIALIMGGYEWSQAEALRLSDAPPPLRKMPEGTMSLAYGKYRANDPVGFKPACGLGSNENALLQRPCAEVLADLGVKYVVENPGLVPYGPQLY
ncbi:MAG: hypothetical protein Q9180_005749, partial [Flavoplaca navasiana]